MRLCFVFFVLCFAPTLVDAMVQTDTLPPVVRSVLIVRKDVFEKQSSDWFFAAPLLNAIHTITREFVIEDELLVEEGDDLDTVRLLETERNLRRIGLFSSVRARVIPISADTVDVLITTQDRISLRPAILFGIGGGVSNYGAKLEETNLFGVAMQGMAYGLFRTENDIGWEGMVELSQRRILRSELFVTAALRANRIRTDQVLLLDKPYRTLQTPWAFGLALRNSYGQDFAYATSALQPTLLPFHDRNITGWISQASGENDRLFTSASFRLSNVQRTLASSRQAFDNTGHLLIAFSSIAQRFGRSVFLNGYETEDIQQGAWGSAVIGRVFSLGNGGETMWYLGGMAEQSTFPSESTYLLGRIGAGSGFVGNNARYTHLDVSGLAHWRIDSTFVLTSRARAQTSWNWFAFRQLVLDFESGLRGYSANGLAGDNRFFTNTELRWFPGWQLWVLGVSGVVFHDFGTVWNQGRSLGLLQFHNAVGAGIRFHNLKASGPDAIFRFDIAYNVDAKAFSGLMFSVNQYFSAFGSHNYRVPDVLGSVIDLQ